MKRVTPSFTVEYRQAKRPNTGSAKLGWAHAKPAASRSRREGELDRDIRVQNRRAQPPADVVSPSIPPGRILPSLVETAPVTGQARLRGLNRGAERAPRKQVVPRRSREAGQWLVNLRVVFILPKPRAVGGSGAMAPRFRVRRPRIRAHQTRDAKNEETDSSSCRKAREVRSCF